jgi:hypothetical protein
MLSDPPLDEFGEFFDFRQNFRGLRFGSNKSIAIVDDIPLPPASVEVVTEWIRSFANRELNHVERNPVVPSGSHAIASTCNRHFCTWSAAL